jgi:hypothetical protein
MSLSVGIKLGPYEIVAPLAIAHATPRQNPITRVVGNPEVMAQIGTSGITSGCSRSAGVSWFAHDYFFRFVDLRQWRCEESMPLDCSP